MTSKKTDKKQILGKLVIVLAVVCVLASTLPQSCKAENNGGDDHIGSSIMWPIKPPKPGKK